MALDQKKISRILGSTMEPVEGDPLAQVMRHKAKTPPTYYVLIRSYEDTGFVSMWISRKDGAAHSGLLHGELVPGAAEEIALALGLPIERERSALRNVKPQEKKECATVEQQQTLFKE